MKNWYHEVVAIGAAPAVRALSDGTQVRVDVATDTPVQLPDGCRGYRRLWTELCRGELEAFEFGNIMCALKIKNIQIGYEEPLL